jgi:hypothetical protein
MTNTAAGAASTTNGLASQSSSAAMTAVGRSWVPKGRAVLSTAAAFGALAFFAPEADAQRRPSRASIVKQIEKAISAVRKFDAWVSWGQESARAIEARVQPTKPPAKDFDVRQLASMTSEAAQGISRLPLPVSPPAPELTPDELLSLNFVKRRRALARATNWSVAAKKETGDIATIDSALSRMMVATTTTRRAMLEVEKAFERLANAGLLGLSEFAGGLECYSPYPN